MYPTLYTAGDRIFCQELEYMCTLHIELILDSYPLAINKPTLMIYSVVLEEFRADKGVT